MSKVNGSLLVMLTCLVLVGSSSLGYLTPYERGNEMIADEMRIRLAALEPQTLEVTDESELHRGHGGWREGGETHFRIRMISLRFQGLSRVARHRLVHETLGDIMPRIHALALNLSEN